jgi:hypothetical protein
MYQKTDNPPSISNIININLIKLFNYVILIKWIFSCMMWDKKAEVNLSIYNLSKQIICII